MDGHGAAGLAHRRLAGGELAARGQGDSGAGEQAQYPERAREGAELEERGTGAALARCAALGAAAGDLGHRDKHVAGLAPDQAVDVVHRGALSVS